MRALSTPGWRRLVFAYELAILGALVVLALIYYKISGVMAVMPERFQGLPVQSAWFGALGGITIALKGVYDHPADPELGEEGWNNRWVLWHLGRPFSGMIVGIATLLLLRAIYPNGTPVTAVVLSAAFVLGTQERRFFEFVNQVGAVIVAVPNQSGNGGGGGGGGSPAGTTAGNTGGQGGGSAAGETGLGSTESEDTGSTESEDTGSTESEDTGSTESEDTGSTWNVGTVSAGSEEIRGDQTPA